MAKCTHCKTQDVHGGTVCPLCIDTVVEAINDGLVNQQGTPTIDPGRLYTESPAAHLFTDWDDQLHLAAWPHEVADATPLVTEALRERERTIDTADAINRSINASPPWARPGDLIRADIGPANPVFSYDQVMGRANRHEVIGVAVDQPDDHGFQMMRMMTGIRGAWHREAEARLPRWIAGSDINGTARREHVGHALVDGFTEPARTDVCYHLRPLSEPCSECRAELGNEASNGNQADRGAAPANKEHVAICRDALCIHGRQVLHGVACLNCSEASSDGGRILHASWVYGAKPAPVVVQQGTILSATAKDDELQVLEDHLVTLGREDEALRLMAYRRLAPLLERIARDQSLSDGHAIRITPHVRELHAIACSLFPPTADEVADAHDRMSREVSGDVHRSGQRHGLGVEGMSPGEYRSPDRDYPLRGPR